MPDVGVWFRSKKIVDQPGMPDQTRATDIERDPPCIANQSHPPPTARLYRRGL